MRATNQRSRSQLEIGRSPRMAPGWPLRSGRDVLDRPETVPPHGAHGTGAGRLGAVIGAAIVAGLLPAIFPLTPGFNPDQRLAVVVAAAIAASAAIGIVLLTQRLASGITHAPAGGLILYASALFSAGAAAIHLSVAKMHFDEYALFGVFFVASGIAQLIWPLWLLLRPWRLLLVLGAAGNLLIVALWGVDRIWGLPLGPDHWKPDPVGFGDSAASTFELLLVAGCVALLVRDRDRPLRPAAAALLALALIAVTALSLVSVLGIGSSFLTPTV